MFKHKQDIRNMIEKQNDVVMFWELIGTPIFYIIGAILIFTIVIGGIKIKNTIVTNREQKEIERVCTVRTEIFNEYLSSNPNTFTDIKSTWNEDNLFYARNNKGTFTVRFVNTKIYEVVYTTNGGFTQILYKE